MNKTLLVSHRELAIQLARQVHAQLIHWEMRKWRRRDIGPGSRESRGRKSMRHTNACIFGDAGCLLGVWGIQGQRTKQEGSGGVCWGGGARRLRALSMLLQTFCRQEIFRIKLRPWMRIRLSRNRFHPWSYALWYLIANNPQTLAFVVRGSSHFGNRTEILVGF